MKKENDKSYFENLLQNNRATKKQIAVYLDDNMIEHMDVVTRLFSSISDSKSFSRNTLIELALNKFLSESEDYLHDQLDVDVDAIIKEARSKKYDTVILSANGRGFEDTFLGEAEAPCWYPCKISDARISSLKYIAIYRSLPISAITHYARIKEFKYDASRDCKVCYFDGDPIPLPNKVTLGNKDACFFIGAKYTPLESLVNAKQADELVFG